MNQEFALMSRNKHTNIVKFLDFIEDCNAAESLGNQYNLLQYFSDFKQLRKKHFLLLIKIKKKKGIFQINEDSLNISSKEEIVIFNNEK